MLHVGARTRDAALSFASSAISLRPTILTSSGSHVAPRAVEDCGEEVNSANDSERGDDTHRKALGGSAHEKVVAPDTIGPIADLVVKTLDDTFDR